MPERNRVTPYGEIVASSLRGEWMGNRGCIHRGHDIARHWATKRWITCALEFKGWVAPKWVRGLVGADAIDAQLHIERLDGKQKRTHAMAWREVPAGVYVELDRTPHLVLGDCLRPWSAAHGYGDLRARPKAGDVVVLTPPLSIRAVVHGYVPGWVS